MTQKITITLHTDGEITAQSLANAVRRAAAANVEIPVDGKVEAKGITIQSQTVKVVPFKSKQAVREWAAENGFPDVVGKRGRISREIQAAYEAAH